MELPSIVHVKFTRYLLAGDEDAAVFAGGFPAEAVMGVACKLAIFQPSLVFDQT